MSQSLNIIEMLIMESTGQPFQVQKARQYGGGCINEAMLIDGMMGESLGKPVRYFVKFNRASRLDMFEAEAEGLHEMASAGAIRVPRPVCTGHDDKQAFLVMEYLNLSGGGSGSGQALGVQLAGLHRKTAARHGWQRDNTIGSTPQRNSWTATWVDFWRDHRLAPQLEMASRKGLGKATLDKGQRLLTGFQALFSAYQPAPSLLHGDLWSGNYGFLESGMPVIFDPATYYGDRETDLAMTELFGGFPRAFYQAYQDAWPLDAGYKTRKTLYNLYHILNHYNLFGGGYGMQADSMLDELLAQL